jgi:hypothetical protein
LSMEQRLAIKFCIKVGKKYGINSPNGKCSLWGPRTIPFECFLLCSLLQSTLVLTRYTSTNVFPTAENISGTLQCWCCSRPHFVDIRKTFPFHLAFHTRKRKTSHGARSDEYGGWGINVMLIFFGQNLLHTQGRVDIDIVVVKEPK